MSQLRPIVPTSTFVVRFWREWSAAGPRWRARIDHVQSGEGAAFLDLDGMLAFISRFVPMGGVKGNGPPPR
jgi:hypothetical protein